MTTQIRLLGIALLLACLGGCGGTPSVQGNPSGQWVLVWEDDFGGTALDGARWSVQTGDGCAQNLCGWGNNELQWYQADNIEVAGGILSLTAREESVAGKAYTSARIRSAEKGDWRYGRFEIRARLPQGQGIWPAVWMLPTDEVYGGWAASGEIDIVESLGHQPDLVHGTLHYGGPWPNNTKSGTAFRLPSDTFADDFHTFVLEWEEDEIRWYVDGVLYQTQTEWHSTAGPYPAPFDQRFHLILNVAVGGTWPGAPDASTVFPQTLEVDFVRVYRWGS